VQNVFGEELALMTFFMGENRENLTASGYHHLIIIIIIYLFQAARPIS